MAFSINNNEHGVAIEVLELKLNQRRVGGRIAATSLRVTLPTSKLQWSNHTGTFISNINIRSSKSFGAIEWSQTNTQSVARIVNTSDTHLTAF
jgi:hypothetical protein